MEEVLPKEQESKAHIRLPSVEHQKMNPKNVWL